MSQKRSEFFTFLNIATGETAMSEPTWALIGDGVTEMSISYNPQSTTEQYIHEDVAHTTITGYQPNAAVTAQCVKGDKVFDYINGFRRSMAIGEDTKTEICMVDRYEKKETNGYPALRQPVTIQIDSYGGAASDPLSIGYTINFDGVAEAGYFDPSTLKYNKESGGGD